MVAGFLIHDGKICIRKRPEGMVWAGLWELPGGRLQKNEPQEKGLIRTFQEKTGLMIEVGKKVGTVKHSYTIHRVTLTGYTVCLVGKKPESLPGGACRWVSIEDLAQYAFSTGHRQLIEKFKQFWLNRNSR